MSVPYKLGEVRQDKSGAEIPDQEPMAIPAGFKIPETLSEQIRRVIRTTLSQAADEQGLETFEESEDFEIDDEMFDPSSPYEEVFDPVLQRGITLDEFKKNEEVYKRRFLEAEDRAYQAMSQSEALRARARVAPSSPAEQSGPEAASGDAAGDGKTKP